MTAPPPKQTRFALRRVSSIRWLLLTTILCYIITIGECICGDGTTDSGETCDDGNTVPWDGCSASCQAENGYTCPTPGVPCAPYLHNVIDLHSSKFGTCASFLSVKIKCWGLETGYGNHGRASTPNVGDEPGELASLGLIPPTGPNNVLDVFRMSDGSCVVLDFPSDTMACWGENRGIFGTDNPDSCGYGSAPYSGCATTLLTTVAGKFFAGVDHACRLDSGGLRCWGYSYGDLGIVGIPLSASEEYVGDQAGEMAGLTDLVFGTTHEVVTMSMSFRSQCALFNNGGARCWGRNIAGFGTLASDDNDPRGNNAKKLSDIPFIPFSRDFDDVVQIAHSWTCSCTLHASGFVRCWGGHGCPGQGNAAVIGDNTGEMLASTVINFADTSPIVKIYAGHRMVCALFETSPFHNQARCWGSNVENQLLDPDQRESIGTGPGQMSTLPYMNFGVTNSVLQISLDHLAPSHCALFNITSTPGVSAIRCWGRNNYGHAGPTGGADVTTSSDLTWLDFGASTDYAVQLSPLGNEGFCALFNNGGNYRSRCWGSNKYGRSTATSDYIIVGDSGTLEGDDVLAVMPGKANGITGGMLHTGAMFTGSGFKGWGDDKGQLSPVTNYFGLKHDNLLNQPAFKYLGVHQPIKVAMTTAEPSFGIVTAVLTSDGQVKTIGFSYEGHLGIIPKYFQSGPPEDLTPVPFKDTTGAVDISCGNACCVVFRSGGIVCWGNNAKGQLGIDSVVSDFTYTDLSLRDNIVFNTADKALNVFAAKTSACATFDIGSGDAGLRCWGAGNSGQLGQDSLTDLGGSPNSVSTIPYITFQTTDVPIQVDGFKGTRCAVFRGAGVRCWGDNGYGQLGVGSTDDWASEGISSIAILPFISFATTYLPVKVAVGRHHVCTLFQNQKVQCWGRGEFGAIGSGATANVGTGGGDMAGLGFLDFSNLPDPVLSYSNWATPVESIDPPYISPDTIYRVTLVSPDHLLMPGDRYKFTTGSCGGGHHTELFGTDSSAAATSVLETATGAYKLCYLRAGNVTSVEQPGVILYVGPRLNVTGTFSGSNETDLHTQAGRTIILELETDQWVASLTSGNAAVNTLLSGFVSALANEPSGFVNTVIPALTTTSLTRNSNTMVTITIPATPTYVVEANEEILIQVPPSLIQGGVGTSTSSSIVIVNDFDIQVLDFPTTEAGMQDGSTIVLALRGALWDPALTTGSASSATFLSTLIKGQGASVNLFNAYPVFDGSHLTRLTSKKLAITFPPVPNYALVVATETITVTINPDFVIGAPDPKVHPMTFEYAVFDSPTSFIINATFPTGPFVLGNATQLNFTFTSLGGLRADDLFRMSKVCQDEDAYFAGYWDPSGTLSRDVPMEIPQVAGRYHLCHVPTSLVLASSRDSVAQDGIYYDIAPANHTAMPHFQLLSIPTLSVTSPPINLWDWMTITRPNPYPVKQVVVTVSNGALFQSPPTTNVTVGTATDPLNVGLYLSPDSTKTGTASLSVHIVYENGLESDSQVQFITVTDIPGPIVTSIIPPRGPKAGGHELTLFGSNFGIDASKLVSAYIGDNLCTQLTWLSIASIKCVAPPQGIQSDRVSINVTTTTGTSVLPLGWKYNPLPVVSAVSPIYTSGSVPSLVTISGDGFGTFSQYLTSVKTAGVPCSAVQWLSPTRVLCTSGTSTTAASGPVDIDSVTSGKSADDPVSTSQSPNFYIGVPAVVTSVSPPQGPASNFTQIRVKGTSFGFNDAVIDQATVMIDDIKCLDVKRESETELTCLTGLSDRVFQGTVRVDTVFGGKGLEVASSGNRYQYTAGIPFVLDFLPKSSLTFHNTSVTITGRSFSSPMKGHISGYPCNGNGEMVVLSPTLAVCSLGSPRKAAIGKVVLETTVGKGSSSQYYIVRARTLNQPAVFSLQPGTGPIAGGIKTEIIGEKFGSTALELGKVVVGNSTIQAGDFLWISATAIAIVTPKGYALGPALVDVETSFGGRSVSIGYFDYHVSDPIGLGGFPRQGVASRQTSITLVGEYFGFNSSSVLEATVAGQPCTNVRRLSSTQMSCLIPSFSTAPTDPEFVVTADGRSSSPFKIGFQFVEPDAICEPACPYKADCVARQCLCQPGWGGQACDVWQFEVSLTALETTEDGGVADLSVRLLTQPTGPVTIGIALSDSTEANVSNPSIVIDSTTQDLTTAVTITGVPDSERDGTQPYDLLFSPTQSTDRNYDKVALDSVRMSNLDSAPTLLGLEPPLSPLNGTWITLYGRNFDSEVQVKIGSVVVQTHNRTDTVRLPPDVSLSSPQQPSRARLLQTGEPEFVTSMILHTPRFAHEVYKTVLLQNAGGSSKSYPRQLFFTDNCPRPGLWGRGTDCRECDACATCPGGYRVWPKAGCWGGTSFDGGEYTEVYKCEEPATRCNGGPSSTCSEGYQGTMCTECESGYFKSGRNVCKRCPDESSQYILLVMDIVVWLLIAASGWGIEDRENLSHVIALVAALQTVAGVGQMVASNLASWMQEIYGVFHLISGDIQFLKPDCQGNIDFEMDFYIRLLYNVFIGLLLFIGLPFANRIAQYLHTKRHGSLGRRNRAAHYKDRAIRILHIWLFLMYLTVATSCFNMLACKRHEGRYVSINQPGHVCWESQDHISASVVASLLLVIYIIGYPVYVFTSERKAHRSGQLRNPKYADKHDLLFEPFKTKWRYFWFGEISLSLALASSETFLAEYPIGQLLLPGILMLVVIILIFTIRPFHRAWEGQVLAMVYVSNLVGLVLIYLLTENVLTANDAGAKVMAYILAALIVGATAIFLSVVGYFIFWRQTENKYNLLNDEGHEGPDGDGDLKRLMSLEYGELADETTMSDHGTELPELKRDNSFSILQTAFGLAGAGEGGSEQGEDPFDVLNSAGEALEALHQSETGIVEKMNIQQPRYTRMRVPIETKPVLLPREAPSLFSTLSKAFERDVSDLPSYWPSQASNEWSVPWGDAAPVTRLTELEATSPLYQEIATLVQDNFHANLVGGGRDNPNLFHDSLTIRKICVSEQSTRWKTFAAQRQLLHETYQKVKPQSEAVDTDVGETILSSQLDEGINEKMLFHGTSPHLVEVLHNTGFDERVSHPPNLFGAGIYFTESSSKADEYSRPVGGVCVMVLSRVLLGLPFHTKKNQADLRRPPCILGHSAEACSHPRFDSVIGGKGDDCVLKKYREFVVYRHTLALPEFFIYYERTGGERQEPEHFTDAPEADALPSREQLLAWSIRSVTHDYAMLRGTAKAERLRPLEKDEEE